MDAFVLGFLILGELGQSLHGENSSLYLKNNRDQTLQMEDSKWENNEDILGKE